MMQRLTKNERSKTQFWLFKPFIRLFKLTIFDEGRVTTIKKKRKNEENNFFFKDLSVMWAEAGGVFADVAAL